MILVYRYRTRCFEALEEARAAFRLLAFAFCDRYGPNWDEGAMCDFARSTGDRQKQAETSDITCIDGERVYRFTVRVSITVQHEETVQHRLNGFIP